MIKGRDRRVCWKGVKVGDEDETSVIVVSSREEVEGDVNAMDNDFADNSSSSPSTVVAGDSRLLDTAMNSSAPIDDMCSALCSLLLVGNVLVDPRTEAVSSLPTTILPCAS